MQESRRRVLRVDSPQGYLGVASVPLPFPVAEQTTSTSWESVLPRKAIQKQGYRNTEVPSCRPSVIAVHNIMPLFAKLIGQQFAE